MENSARFLASATTDEILRALPDDPAESAIFTPSGMRAPTHTILVKAAQAKAKLVEEEKTISGIIYATKRCKIPSLQQKNGRQLIREIQNASLFLTIAKDVLGDPIGADGYHLRCKVVVGFDFFVANRATPGASRGIKIEILANGSSWRTIHHGRLPGSSMRVGEVREFKFEEQFNALDYITASDLRLTINSDNFYA